MSQDPLPCHQDNDIDDNNNGNKDILEILVDPFTSIYQENKKSGREQQTKEKLHCRIIFAVIVWQRPLNFIDNFLFFAFKIKWLGFLGLLTGNFGFFSA
ncbi:MAG: hypothetical protein PHS94_09445 [Erysipelotrichaceae bacterium]|nr:hypothetical protein [Erysipelotrichaceae bacterium]